MPFAQHLYIGPRKIPNRTKTELRSENNESYYFTDCLQWEIVHRLVFEVWYMVSLS